jgi:hypothetical protein
MKDITGQQVTFEDIERLNILFAKLSMTPLKTPDLAVEILTIRQALKDLRKYKEEGLNKKEESQS